MTDRELMQQALDALKLIDEAMPFPVAKLTIKNLRERMAQPEQESFSPEAISATQAAWKMGYDAAKAEQPEQEPVVWVLPKMHPVMELRAQRGFRVYRR